MATWATVETAMVRVWAARGVPDGIMAEWLRRPIRELQQKRFSIGFRKKRTNPAWSSDDEARLLEMRDQGLSQEQIAAALGRSFDAVRFRCFMFSNGGKIDRRVDDESPAERPLRVPAHWARFMCQVVEADPQTAATTYRRPARLLAALIRRADLVTVEGDDDGLALDFLAQADRLERIARLG